MPGIEPKTLLLASASPRRKELLEALGHRVQVRSVDVDESERPGETPAAYIERIVAAKLAAARQLTVMRPFDAIVVADTMVVVDQEILQKPTDDADGARMLRLLSGRAHVVVTRFGIAGFSGGRHVESVATRVIFRELGEEEIADYVTSGEGRDKAGGYGIQGRAAAFISRIEGSYGAVVGLPSCEVSVALAAMKPTPY